MRQERMSKERSIRRWKKSRRLLERGGNEGVKVSKGFGCGIGSLWVRKLDR